MMLKRKKSAQTYIRALVNPNKRTKSNKLLHLVPPTLSSSFKYNLPVSLTPFIGRQAEVEEICHLFKNPVVRLVTLYGTAGLGKTRLSVAVGEKLQNQFRDGVFFVNLAPLSKPELGLAAIAQALGLQDQRQVPLLEKLQNYLQRRSLLLILDNFEQIVDLGPAVCELLAAAPQLKVIVTSRVVLRLYGEHVYSVPALQLLKLNKATSFENLCQNEAVSLFCQGARMVNPHFQLTRANAETVARLCIQLEGLPLAIELAAARCDVFSPQALLDRLGAGKRFELLVGGFSNLPRRQQTLADALEWSYQLLSEPEKQIFRTLGVFVDSCSLAAAQAMSGDTLATLDTIGSLINKSLLKRVEAMPGEELRFTMLETIREFALEKLNETGELATARAAHSRFFIEMVVTGSEHLTQPEQFNWLRRLTADHPNILSALEYLIESADVEGAYRLGSRIWSAWWRWGYLSQGRQWLNKILALPGGTNVDNIIRARILEGVAYLAMHQNDYHVAETYFEESLKIWRENGVSKNLGTAISGLAGTYRTLGNYERALQLNYESLDLFRILDEDVHVADALCNIAWQLMERGNYEQVQSMLEESLALHTRANYLSGIARAKIYLGDFLWRKDNPQQAIQYMEEAIALLRQVNHRIRLPSVLYRLGLIYLCQGQLAQAEKLLEESVETAEEMHKPLDLTYAYSNLGLLRMVQKDLVGAEVLFRKALRLRSEIGQPEGVLWALEGLAVVALEQSRHTEAQKLMGEAKLLRQAVCAPILPHTLKFILPRLVNHNKLAHHQVGPANTRSRLGGEDRAVETIPPAASLLISQPLSFGLEAAIALSKRENEVLKLIAQGHRTSQIAKILVISPGTVNNHLNSIYSKLGVNSRTAAVRYALDHSLL